MYPFPSVATDGQNYLVFHGESALALVAHIDTVKREHTRIKQKGNVIRNDNEVLGADDLAGVYGIIMAAKHACAASLPMPTLIFTNGEESGGIGVSKLIEDKALEIKGINLFVEMDRQGCNDFVYYSYNLPKAVKKYVKQWGYIEGVGSFSDISFLTEEYEIPAVNISCGYYHQHSAKETLHVDELELNIARVVQMLKNPIQELHKIDSWDSQDLGWGYGHGSVGRGCGRYDDFYDSYRKSGNSGNWMEKNPGLLSGWKDHPLDQEEECYDIEVEEVDPLHGYYGEYEMDDLRSLIRQELCCDGSLSSTWELLLPDQHGLLAEMEETFCLYMELDPTKPDEIFEDVWYEVMEKLYRAEGKVASGRA